MYQRIPSTADGLGVLHGTSRLTTLPLNTYFVSIYSSSFDLLFISGQVSLRTYFLSQAWKRPTFFL